MRVGCPQIPPSCMVRHGHIDAHESGLSGCRDPEDDNDNNRKPYRFLVEGTDDFNEVLERIADAAQAIAEKESEAA